MSGISRRNLRRRRRLHLNQKGKCFYCPDDVDVMRDSPKPSVLEHYIPRAAGGTRVVLACVACDKMKGMIKGPEFQEIIASVIKDYGIFSPPARNEIKRLCKLKNMELQSAHPKRLEGEIRTRARSEASTRQKQVVFTNYPTLEEYLKSHSSLTAKPQTDPDNAGERLWE